MHYPPVQSVSITVGQRKKVTAVTFFPARPRPDHRGTNTDQKYVKIKVLLYCEALRCMQNIIENNEKVVLHYVKLMNPLHFQNVE